MINKTYKSVSFFVLFVQFDQNVWFRKLQKLQTEALPALFILCGDEDSTVRS